MDELHSKEGEKSYVEVVKLHSMVNFSSKVPQLQKVDSDKSSPIQSYWVRKEHEALRLDLENLWIVSRLFAHNEWKEIKATFEDHFQSKVLINPLFDDKTLIKIGKDICDIPNVSIEKWKSFGDYHLCIEKLSRKFHSHPNWIKGYGGWISIKNLLLEET